MKESEPAHKRVLSRKLEYLKHMHSGVLVLHGLPGEGKTEAALHFATTLELDPTAVFRVSATAFEIERDVAAWLQSEEENGARAHIRSAAESLRSASTVAERRTAVTVFLAALGELIACLLRFLVRVLILLLSRLLGRAAVENVPVWKPDPIDTSPQITPRGPNSALPLITHRGGHHRSALGSAVIAA
ncbi:hypothetical protein ACFYYH_11335 [Streptomyces sp. NPDC002018]|uniref:hypothetical protein n=1 Tax=Streptomyces sp. NPDC002018 TaxID=3364629 RepID=UPI0036931F6D